MVKPVGHVSASKEVSLSESEQRGEVVSRVALENFQTPRAEINLPPSEALQPLMGTVSSVETVVVRTTTKEELNSVCTKLGRFLDNLAGKKKGREYQDLKSEKKTWQVRSKQSIRPRNMSTLGVQVLDEMKARITEIQRDLNSLSVNTLGK